MILPIDADQERLLNRSTLDPVFLVDITSTEGTLRYCTKRSVSYLGNRYQPYVSAVGTLRTAASFPENNTSSKELQLQFNNGQVEYAGTVYDHLSQIFYPVFPWELADVTIRLLLTDGETETFTEDVAIPWVTGGVAGAPTRIDRQKFILPVYTRNFKLNDQIPLRPVTQEDFPEADRDELNGRTYIPIIIGQSVRVRALATGAGATTTVRTQVSTGTTLDVTETTGFSNGDSIIVGGLVDDALTIGTVDAANNRFTGVSPDISTLPQALQVGDVVREDKAQYSYTIADHSSGDISAVYVTKRGTTEPVLISGSKYSKDIVADSNSIGGLRTDVQISELIAFGESAGGGVTQQPEHDVDNANHDHNVSVGQTTTSTSYASATNPAGASNANDGNAETYFQLDDAGTKQVYYTSHSSLNGTYVSQRYFMIAADSVSSGEVRMHRDATSSLTITGVFAKGEFRSGLDTGGDENDDWYVILNDSGGTALLYEGWKEVTMAPSVSEDLVDLTDTTRTQDVAVDVSGANIEVGDKVEVVINGIPVPDTTGRYGPTDAFGDPIERPDGVARWILVEAMGESENIIDPPTYSGAASTYEAEGIRLAFAIQQPIKLDTLFDQIANNSNSMHYWGRAGHVIRYLEETPTVTGTFSDDERGVLSVDWQSAHIAADIRNKLNAFYGRNWTSSANKEDSYSGNVVGEDSASQALFGVLGNEVVNGQEKSLFLDMTPTEDQAQDIADAIVGAKSTPKKEFRDETDWTYITIEPGDVIIHNSPTLPSAYNARVIENTIDSRLFCRIVAKETSIAVSVPDDTDDQVSLEFNGSNEAIASLTGDTIGIENQWSIALWHKWNSGEQYGNLIDIGLSATSDNNRIRIDMGGYGAEGLQIICWNTSGTIRKQYIWNSFFSFDVWQHLVVTWDGSSLLAYRDGSPDSPDATPTNSSLTQADNSRRIVVGAGLSTGGGIISPNPGYYMDGKIYSVAIWGTPLTSDEVTAIYNSGNGAAVNLAAKRGDYTSFDDLEHWYRLGSDSGSIGKDFAGIKHLNTTQNMDATNIVSDYPSGA